VLQRVWRARAVAAVDVLIAGASHVSDLGTMGATSILDQPLPETPLQLPAVEPGTATLLTPLVLPTLCGGFEGRRQVTQSA